MIKELLSSALKSQGPDLLNSLGLAPEKQDKALDLAKGSILGGLTDSLAGGGISNITKAFSSGTSSPLVQSIISNYGSDLISKLGLSDSLAKTISTTLIPLVFKFINKKDDAPTDNDEGVQGMLGDLMKDGVGEKLGGLLKGKFKF